MQYYRDGFHPGDPAVVPADRPAPTLLPDSVDVLIVGTGPAGLVLAAQLARFPGITTRIVERRTGPLEMGQADGVACRTIEMFQGFGFAEQLLHEAYWVNETVFWGPAEGRRDHIVRTGRVQDVEDGLSQMPHVIMNQARIHEYLLQAMRNSPTRLAPDYGLEFIDLEVAEDGAHPVTVTLRDVTDDTTRTVRASYVIGCDGARSGVRKAIGRELVGDRANHAWGVMDILASTDFPDIRFKAAIQSAAGGSILLIPREGGHLVRLYVDLGVVTEDNREEIRGMSAEQVAEVANRALHPHSLEVKETVWFSVYEVAQRLTDGFDDVAGRGSDRGPHVFIAGDACHTHSAKAGQGMNVSMQDAFNLGWKLAAVLEGRSDASLLETYSAERQPVAQELIDFDKEWSAMLAGGAVDSASAAEVSDYFVRQGRYTAGVAVRYTPSRLTGTGEHQQLATGFEVGTRFHSAPVVRVADGKRMELGHCAAADGRWRLYAFADAAGTRLEELCEWLVSAEESPVVRHSPKGADLDAVIDVRGIWQRPHADIDFGGLPHLLRPATGRLGLTDYEKAFAPDLKSGPDIFDLRGVSRAEGALVLVRPDQYVAQVLPLDGYAELSAFFADLLTVPAAR
ncbi:FAD-dependent monooxygenase [Nocardioides insulae]|uniref:FAD-dependent monooxygenase n=1 Tax=Nocardioides insulae TaxID=394734 RepID=UPI000425E68F|nr:FAD-dependent monooxygenase [Nocardioides insulae]